MDTDNGESLIGDNEFAGTRAHRRVKGASHMPTEKRKKAAPPLPEGIVDDMRELMRTDVEIGLESHDMIVRMAVQVLADEHECSEDDLRPLAEQILPEIVKEFAKEQESWPGITDCDRLDAAFADLNWSGIVCRQHFTCCTSCGHKEIWKEIEAERESGCERVVRGYAFYHAQSADAAVEGNGLWLNHGSVDDESASLRIAQEIVDSLGDHGLDVSWPGSADKSIHVKMDWKRRVPLGEG